MSPETFGVGPSVFVGSEIPAYYLVVAALSFTLLVGFLIWRIQE